MNTYMKLVTTFAVCAMFGAACSQGERTDDVAPSLTVADDELGAGTSVASFEMRWPRRSTAEVSARSLAIAEMIAGKPLRADALTARLERGLDPKSPMVRPFEEDEDIVVEYHAEFDDLRVFNSARAESIEPGQDVGEAAARELLRKHVSELSRQGLVDATHFDLDAAQIAYEKSAAGRRGEAMTNAVVEGYLFTLRRRLNGIDVANAGLRVQIHRSGRLTSVRLGGVEVASVRQGSIEMPEGEGTIGRRAVSDKEIRDRFLANRPAHLETRILAEGLVYVMPDDAERAVVEPVYAIHHVYEGPVDGKTVISRRRATAYSVLDATAPPSFLWGTTPPPR